MDASVSTGELIDALLTEYAFFREEGPYAQTPYDDGLHRAASVASATVDEADLVALWKVASSSTAPAKARLMALERMARRWNLRHEHYEGEDEAAAQIEALRSHLLSQDTAPQQEED